MTKRNGFLIRTESRKSPTRCFAALFPESVKRWSILAGLLTCPILGCLPVPRVGQEQWLGSFRGFPLCGEDLQQRVCSGVSPDSLFIVHSEAGGGSETRFASAKVGIILGSASMCAGIFCGSVIICWNQEIVV